MTANAGYHLFNTGDVLTAAQVQYNLQNQTIMYFATAAARNSALSGVLVEGMFCYLADTNSTEYYDGAAWVSIASSGDLTAITAGNGISVTSGTGPVPTVAIDTSVTVDTTTAQTLTNKTLTSAALTTPTISTLTTNGDLLYGTGSGALSRLGIGSAGQVVTVAAGLPSWATPTTSTSFPAFAATKSATQTITAATFTKITFDVETFDTASNFASSRFTPTTAGYYQINAVANMDPASSAYVQLTAYKNGSNYAFLSALFPSLDESYPSGSVLVSMNGSSDYLEIYARCGVSCDVFGGTAITQFNGVGIRSL